MITYRRIAFWAAVLWLPQALIPNGRGQGLERFIDGVVEVEVGRGANKAKEIGTGFIVSANGGAVSALTARHLFYEGRNSFTKDISVVLYLDKLHSHKAVIV